MTCSVCKSTEHNKRRCPNTSSIAPFEKRSRGRPSKHLMQRNHNAVGEVVTPSGEAVVGRGRVGRGGVRVGRRRGRGAGLAATGMGVIYDEGGSILYRSSVSGPVVEYFLEGPSQVSQQLSHSAPNRDNQT